jgi:hypothetical protein
MNVPEKTSANSILLFETLYKLNKIIQTINNEIILLESLSK